MARGDKNKHDSPGRRIGNQTDQSFIRSNKHPKSNHNKGQTRRRRSDPNEPQTDSDVGQYRSSEAEHELKAPHSGEKRFDILVDNVPYIVKAMPFIFNGEIRYRVNFNGGPEHVFTWDSSLGQLRAIDDDSSTLPDNLEEAISEKLQSKI